MQCQRHINMTPHVDSVCADRRSAEADCTAASLLGMRQLFWPFALVAVVPFMPFRATAHFMAGEPFLLACYHAPAD